MRHFPIREAAYVVGLIALLVVAYVGAYSTLVQRGYLEVINPENHRLIEPEYRIEDEWIATVFEPIHAIDRQVRASYWADESVRDMVVERRNRAPGIRLVPKEAVRE